ncbi:MAG: sodium:proton antiporter NhaD [Firmicutes bacterium]|nr:sodium:proton antiporter NhaD [Bacillota bacterium]MCM1401969.1 sodium:proton antiporter NhaD [Bacteroides sp.]MCM1477910.1 sodium:proton antiporter NhaD [Bacteroides sp.]
MITSLLVIFIVGYLLIASEHVLGINKATFALIMCGLLWAVYSMCGHDPNLSEDLITALGDTCEIVVFLIGAMTIVELIDRYGGFHIMVEKLHAGSKRKLLWSLAIVAFFLSSILDNMTTTIIMVMMLRRMLRDQKERWTFACVIVLAANAGGAWSPIGDITTIMLWMKNYVSSVDLIVNLVIPSMVSVLIPTYIASRFIPATPMEELNDQDERKGYAMSEHHRNLSIIILICGVAGLLFVPLFKAITHLPPYLGILLSLGFLWLLTELIVRHYQLDGKIEGRISQVVRNIDMSTILFFLGILMAVSALGQAGILESLAAWLNDNFHNVYIISGIIGVLSSIVDNVPLVAACMEMYPAATDAMIAASADPSYMSLFVADGLFWHLLTFCAGVGGSMLIIGSAAGVVAMGIEKIPFMWYAKRITWMAFIGYIAGMATIWLETLLLPI